MKNRSLQGKICNSCRAVENSVLTLSLPVNCRFFQLPKKLLEQLQNQGIPPDLIEEDSGHIESENDEKWMEFDSMAESWFQDGPSSRPDVRMYAGDEADDEVHVLCARCYSLRHYGRVKNAEVEEDIDKEFDFERKVGRKIALQKFRRQIVLAVVDIADFDGSLPRVAIRSLLTPEERALDPSRLLPRTFRLLIAVNKSDLLPTQVSPRRLENWVRKRMTQGGLPRPSAVHVVSSTQKWGIRSLLADLQSAVGGRGDIWVVGAQNAGKSSLINAMRSEAGLKEERNLTSAPLPGTTLGIVKVPGLLPKGCKMLDTPGVIHEYQLASYMTADEMKMLLPKRPFKPRTYRLGAGQSVALGGVARLDVISNTGATVYLTVWASDELMCHLGKTEGVEERYAKHVGTRLVPPVGGPERVENGTFPALQGTDVHVIGDSWKESSVDIAIAGLGWVGVGVNGEASFRVWAPPNVAVTSRDALVPDYAKEFERPGFGEVKGLAAVSKKEKKKKR